MERERRKVTVALFLSLLLLWGTFEAQPVFIDALLRNFGWNHAQVSWIAAVASLGIGVVGPIAGLLLDRFDARFIMSGGAVMVGLGALLSATCNGLSTMIAATALYSIGLGASTVLPASLVVANWYEPKRRGAAIGSTLAGMEVGGMLLTIVCGMVIANFGWRAGFIVSGLPAILLAAPLLFFAVRARPPVAIPSNGANELAHGMSNLPGMEISVAVRTRTFWGLAGVQLASGLLIGGMFPFLVSFFIGIGCAPSTAIIVVTASYGAVIVGKPVLGWLADRAGGRVALVTGFTCWSVVSLGLMAVSKPWSVILFLGFIGLALPAGVAVVPTVIANKFGLRRFGSIYGWLQVGNTAGLFLGPLAIGTLADLMGGYGGAFRLLLVVSVLGALSAMLCGGKLGHASEAVAHG